MALLEVQRDGTHNVPYEDLDLCRGRASVDMALVPRFQPNKAPIRLRIGTIELASRYTLAPLAGYTNLAFRMAVRSCGGLGLATTDLINARGLLSGSQKTIDLIATMPDDRPLSVQIYGRDAGELSAAAQWLENYGATFIDINMGCPVHKVTKGGGGSAMMCNPTATVQLVSEVVKSVKIPVTVKMRLGWDSQTLSAPYFAQAFEAVGVAALTIHGRTRAQGFKGSVDRTGIRAVVAAVKSIPVLGNGDVRSIEDAQGMFAETECHGIAIGRGALLNPWLFTQLVHHECTGETIPGGTIGQHIDFMKMHFQRLVALKGERYGCLTFCKMANWYGKAIPMGKPRQVRLAMIREPASFYDVVADIRDALKDRLATFATLPDSIIAVPSGPNERW
jgi:nifR3 family TIM-barrel protein